MKSVSFTTETSRLQTVGFIMSFFEVNRKLHLGVLCNQIEITLILGSIKVPRIKSDKLTYSIFFIFS